MKMPPDILTFLLRGGHLNVEERKAKGLWPNQSLGYSEVLDHWGAIAYFLFRWRRWAGGLFTGLSVIAAVVHIMSTGVERRFDEQMAFRVIEVGDYRTLEISNSRGDTVTAGSPEIVARVRSRNERTVQVSMVGWYDYGRLRAYRVESIDGVRP